MMKHILIFSVIVAIIILLFHTENSEGFYATQKKINSGYRKANRKVRNQSNTLYNNITSTGNRIMRQIGI
jgi:FtsZ-interacting cell division protein ZipA